MPEPRQSHCPTCDGPRAVELHGSIYKSWSYSDDDGNSAHGGDEHALVECRGCETVFYERISWDSENVEHSHNRFTGELEAEYPKTIATYPKPESKTKPVWVDGLFYQDAQLFGILGEAYKALDNQSYILAAIGLRTALDRATEVLGIDPSYPFEKKLEELLKGGWIGATEREVLGVVTDAGNAAAHRGWAPNSKEIGLLFSSFEVFLQRAFVVGKRALTIKENIPLRPPKK